MRRQKDRKVDKIEEKGGGGEDNKRQKKYHFVSPYKLCKKAVVYSLC